MPGSDQESQSMSTVSTSSVPAAPRLPSVRAKELIFSYSPLQKFLLIFGSIWLAIGLPLTIPAMLFGPEALFALLFPLIGVASVVAGVRSNRRAVRAFTHGTPIRARVSFRGPDHSVRINGRNPYKVAWKFQVNGREYSGSLSHMSRSAPDELLEAEELIVLYDPQDPRSNTVWIGGPPASLLSGAAAPARLGADGGSLSVARNPPPGLPALRGVGTPAKLALALTGGLAAGGLALYLAGASPLSLPTHSSLPAQDGAVAEAPAPLSAEADEAALRLTRLQAWLAEGPAPAEAVPALTGMLGDRDPGIRALAVEALGALGSQAAGAVPALHEAAVQDPGLQSQIQAALERIAAAPAEALEPESEPAGN
jgi:hypothetical protein